MTPHQILAINALPSGDIVERYYVDRARRRRLRRERLTRVARRTPLA